MPDNVQTPTAETEAQLLTSAAEATKAQKGTENQTPEVAEGLPVKEAPTTTTPASTAPAPSADDRVKALEDRIKSIQAGYDGTVAQMRAAVKAANDRAAALELAKRETEYADFLRGVEAKGGDMDAARMIVEAQRSAAKREADIAAREAALEEARKDANERLRVASVYDTIKKYNLPEKVKDELLKAETPEAMTIRALELTVENLRTSAKTTPKVDGTGDEGQVPDITKEHPVTTLGKLIEIERQRRK